MHVSSFLSFRNLLLGSIFREHKVRQTSLPLPNEDLEGLTKEEIRIFEALLKGVSTRFGLRTIAKYIENLDFIFCQSFQNLRLGSIKFDRHIGM